MNQTCKVLSYLGSVGIASVLSSSAWGATVAHWDFSPANAMDGAYIPGNGCRADLDGDGAMDADDFVISAPDLSGNGNHLTVWTCDWMKWCRDSALGDFSMQHGNSYPCAGTDSAFNSFVSGKDVEAITPAQWTVEAVFKSAKLAPFCTIVGRDGRYVGGSASSAAALYLSTRGTDLAIAFTDVDGGNHNLQVPANLKAGVWYSVAAVSDGATLSLYLNGEVIGTLDLTVTGTDTSLGLGYGIWSVARGMWADGHVDRFFGVIDEVSISDEALSTGSFVISVPEICVDSDHDGISDLYELFFHLNPTNSADALENLDSDTLNNFAEFILSTDPRAIDTDTDGLKDDADLDPLSRAVMLWGNSWFTSDDTYSYTGPDWWLGAGKIGGVWANGSGWTVPAYEKGLLYMDVDRTLVTNDLVLNLLHQNVGACQVYLDLGDTNGTYVATNLYSDIADGDGGQELARFVLPLAAYPSASKIIIDATASSDPYTVWLCTLYEDSDADGLDVEQEAQFGTLDTNSDCDADTLSDYIEVMIEGTDPLSADSDGDGFTDDEELLRRGSSPLIPMQQEGGVAGLLQVERWYNIDGDTIASLTDEWRFGAKADDCILVDSTEYAPDNLDVADHYGVRMRGTITAPMAGRYTFYLTGDDVAQVWLSPNESPYERRLLLDLQNWTDFEDLSDEDVSSAVVQLTSNQTCYVEILLKENIYPEHVSLMWTLPGESAPKVIGSQYIHSYVQPFDDEDGDGLPDIWENKVGFGSPNLPNGGGLRDADGDAYSDFEEYKNGTDPTVADEDKDRLSGGDEVLVTHTDPLSADTDGDGTNDLTTALSILGASYTAYGDTHIWSTWSNDGTNATVKEAHSDPWVSYDLSITNAGMYRLAIDTAYGRSFKGIADEVTLLLEIDGIEQGEVWMNHTKDLPSYTLYTPWLAEGEHSLKVTVHYDKWEAVSFQIKRVELGAIDGADADGNGIQDWMEAILAQSRDTDGDGITDADELVLGTGVMNADTDNDGLLDGEELTAGTDPLNADSDNDGVVDGVEINETLTNPLYSEFDGTATTVLSVSGVQTNSAAGTWVADGAEIRSEGRRGYVEYKMDFPQKDLYCLNINAAHLWQKSSCSPVEPIDTSAFLIYVDGIFVGEYEFVSADGVYKNVRTFLPVMTVGEHTVRIFWDNVYSRLKVQIADLQLQSLGGPDSDGNGIKDWVETSLHAMAGIDEVTSSYISPACIEGDARYVPLVSISGGTTNAQPVVKQSAGDRWYANLPLKEDGATTATATFQNGALEVPFLVDWVPYNMMDHNGETLTIRKGDSLKLEALPGNAHGGQFTLMLSGKDYRSPNTHPLAFDFPEAGTYIINGDYRKGNTHTYATVTIEVLDGSFPQEHPACLINKQREWTFEGMPSNMVYEVDQAVDLSLVSCEANATNQSSIVTKLVLKASEANADHKIVARIPSGAILDVESLDTFWIQNAVDGYFWTVERYEDSELWEVRSIAKNVPDSVDIQIKVIVGGVTLDDYTLERWVTNADYSDIGEYNFRLFHPNDEGASVCHTFKVYENGKFIGAAFSGQQSDIE